MNYIFLLLAYIAPMIKSLLNSAAETHLAKVFIAERSERLAEYASLILIKYFASTAFVTTLADSPMSQIAFRGWQGNLGAEMRRSNHSATLESHNNHSRTLSNHNNQDLLIRSRGSPA